MKAHEFAALVLDLAEDAAQRRYFSVHGLEDHRLLIQIRSGRIGGEQEKLQEDHDKENKRN